MSKKLQSEMSSDEFKSIRKSIGYTQIEMAKALGITRRMVIYYENGDIPINETTSKLMGYIQRDTPENRALYLGIFKNKDRQ